ncbi:3148_t:CDS:2 [Paraglomus occultum]|uniref:RNA helicase n=1 Tax=Paraglomus occultum TaxID=144539 RepID=A0A9N9F3P0_9GLOM|nr:3148_t:CDS:2 [Paraglomus occultum]
MEETNSIVASIHSDSCADEPSPPFSAGGITDQQPALNDIANSIKRIEDAIHGLTQQILELNKNEIQQLEGDDTVGNRATSLRADNGIHKLNSQLATPLSTTPQPKLQSQAKRSSLTPLHRISVGGYEQRSGYSLAESREQQRQPPIPPQLSYSLSPDDEKRESVNSVNSMNSMNSLESVNSLNSINSANSPKSGNGAGSINNTSIPEHSADDMPNLFESMRLKPELLCSILALGLDRPTSIQQCSIPLIIKGDDIIAQAMPSQERTRTFAIPTLHHIDPYNKQTQALVLSSVKESAGHVFRTFSSLINGMMTPLDHMLCVNGTNINDDVKKVQKMPHIIIGTPDRVLDLVNLGAVSLSQLKLLVLEDADNQILPAHKSQLIELRQKVPITTSVQTLIFAANVTPDIVNLTEIFAMREPVRILVKKQDQVVKNIRQFYLYIAVDREDWKLEALADLLEDNNHPSAIIYCNDNQTIDNVMYKLCTKNLNAVALHNDMGPSQHNAALARFRNGTDRVLITTQALALQRDVHQVPLAINYDLPSRPEIYVQRIACTTPSGFSRPGVVINFVTSRPQDISNLRAIESFCKVKMLEMRVTSDLATLF